VYAVRYDGDVPTSIDLISPEQAATRRRERPDDVVLLDCREPLELTMASIDGAVHIPMNDVPARCTELDPDKEVIVFCHGGVRSQHVTAFLRDRGFTRVSSMTGGIDAWSCTVDDTVPRY
jgi:rhodanese-related sulfurtransferase